MWINILYCLLSSLLICEDGSSVLAVVISLDFSDGSSVLAVVSSVDLWGSILCICRGLICVFVGTNNLYWLFSFLWVCGYGSSVFAVVRPHQCTLDRSRQVKSTCQKVD